MQPGTWAQRAASNVRAELARLNLTQAWLAERLGMNAQTLNQRLKGDGAPISLDVEEVGRIAEAIGEHVQHDPKDVAARLWP